MKLSFLALLPTILALAAMIITVLCILAGSKPGFMEDYSIIALNTSRIGQNIIDQAANKTSTTTTNILNKFDPSKDDRFASYLNNLAKPLANKIKNFAGRAVNSLADEFGLDDFYSMHVMNYCEGNFSPTPLPNATVKMNDIKRNVTYCSNTKAMFVFNPKAALEQSLNRSGTGVTLESLGWPDELDDGITALKTGLQVTFVMYCIGALLAFCAVIVGLWWTLKSSKKSVVTEAVLASLSFLALLIASIAVTIVGVKGDKVIDKYGAKIGVEAVKGNGYLGLTWAATVLMFLVILISTISLFWGKRQSGRSSGKSVV